MSLRKGIRNLRQVKQEIMIGECSYARPHFIASTFEIAYLTKRTVHLTYYAISDCFIYVLRDPANPNGTDPNFALAGLRRQSTGFQGVRKLTGKYSCSQLETRVPHVSFFLAQISEAESGLFDRSLRIHNNTEHREQSLSILVERRFEQRKHRHK